MHDQSEKGIVYETDSNVLVVNTLLSIAQSLSKISDMLYDITYLSEVQRREKHRHLTHDIEQ